MRSTATAYPTRRKASYWYMPLVPVACVCLMLIGVGLWVHYTLRMYYAGQQTEQILGLTVTSLPRNISRIYNALVGTAVVYCIFAAVILGLGAWKGWVESDQDLQGRLYEHIDKLMYAIVAMQVAWGLLLIWVVLMLAGDAVFAGWIYVVRNSLLSAVTTQNYFIQNNGNATVAPSHPAYTCPATCFNANAFAFIAPEGAAWDNSLCVCDYATLQAAYSAINFAYGAFGGLFVGIVFMYVYGMLLAHWMVAMFTNLRTCQDFSERLLGAAK